MNIAVTIKYDNKEQFLDTVRLAKCISECVNADGGQKINIKVRHDYPKAEPGPGRSGGREGLGEQVEYEV